jgi:hypothetical protein
LEEKEVLKNAAFVRSEGSVGMTTKYWAKAMEMTLSC